MKSKYFQDALNKENSGDYEEAIKSYNKILELDPNDCNAYNDRGILKNKLGDYEGAIGDYNKAIEINPNDAYFYNNRANSKYKLGDYEGTIEDYNRALELAPGDAMSYNNRGISKSELEDYEGAIEDYNKALKLDPEYAMSYNNRGISKSELEDYEGAIEDFNKAIELDPRNTKAKTNLLLIQENISKGKGFLTFADILGWKGIWQKKEIDPNEILEKLITIKKKLQELDPEGKELKINLISDTFVIFCEKIKLHNKACKLLIESCLKEGLLIRGAIAYGEHYNKETVYVGPAVDEAASWHEKAEEVSIFYTNSAKLRIKDLRISKDDLSEYFLEKREVISKIGKIDTYSINWASKTTEKHFYDIMKNNQVYPELYSKYNNTEKYLEEQKKSRETKEQK